MRQYLLIIPAAAVLLTGCGEMVEPAQKAKVLQPSGYTEEILGVGRHWPGIRGKLIKLDVGVNTVVEPVPAKLSDGQDIQLDVRTRGRIAGDDKTLNAMFNSIPVPQDGFLTYATVYKLYIQPEVREAARAAAAKYNSLNIAANYVNLAQEVNNEVAARTKNLPVVLESTSLGKVQYPDTVRTAINKATARQMEIAEAEARVEIELTKATGREKVANAAYAAKMAEAKAVADSNQQVAKSLTPLLLEYNRLEVARETMSNINPDQTDVVYLPYEVIGTPAQQIQALTRGQD